MLAKRYFQGATKSPRNSNQCLRFKILLKQHST